MNDLFITVINILEIAKFKEETMTEFEMSNIGKLTLFLEMEFVKI